MSETSIVSLVFAKKEERSLRVWVASFLALVAHGVLLVWAVSLHENRPPAKEKPKEYLVEIEPPKPPAPKPAPVPEPLPEPAPEPTPAAAPPVKNTPAPKLAASKEPPAPAAAGKIIAAEPDPSAPVDFGDNTFVTGEGKSFVGGTTASNGTGQKPVYTKDVSTDPKPKPVENKPPKGPSKARSVSLEESRWSCSWPKEADREQIDEQSVVLKVLVDPKGKVTSVNLVNDPGFGFGAAATACAYQTRFSPALDATGAPIAALSPPIRVRFTR